MIWTNKLEIELNSEPSLTLQIEFNPPYQLKSIVLLKALIMNGSETVITND